MWESFKCKLGIHSWQWGDIETESWAKYDYYGTKIQGSNYTRDYIIATCKCCGYKTKRFI